MKETVKDAGSRTYLRCAHQAGVIYMVPAELSWVCSPENLKDHALAGFFGELTALANPQVQALMKQWGVYFRPLPLDMDTLGEYSMRGK